MRCNPRSTFSIVRCSVLLLFVFVAGCGQQNATSDASTTQTTAPTTVSVTQPPAETTAVVAEAVETVTTVAPAATATSSRLAQATAGPGEFTNPVIDHDFPDPDVLKVGDMYYAYATNSSSTNIQTARSKDLVNWETLADSLPSLPSWARSGLTWAPEVTTAADGKTYVMYFTARDNASDKQCIGVATSDKPEGPFKGVGDKAFICQSDIGGSIDASAFADDDGKRYVLWKNDGNCCGFATWLHIQQVSDDGLTLQGEPTKLIRNDKAWEGILVEAPTLWKHNNKYYLFYSANEYFNQNYAVGYAIADQATGPYTKPTRQPLLKTDFRTYGAFGPGGQDVVIDDDGETWLMYHSWDSGVLYRAVQIDELVWEGETPVVKGPDKKPQPVP